MTEEEKKTAQREACKRWYQGHKKEVAKYQKQYRVEHKEEIAERGKQYYQEHKGKKSQYAKQYYREHKEEVAERGKKWYQEYKEEIAEHRKQYREEHKEERNQYSKQYYQEHKDERKIYREEHKEERNQYSKQYYQEHKDERAEYKKQYNLTKKGRAKKIASAYRQYDMKRGFDTSNNITSDWIVDNIFTQKCIYCGREEWQTLGADRIDNNKPHTPDNVVCCCGLCNVERNDNYTVEEFKQYKQLYPTLALQKHPDINPYGSIKKRILIKV